MRRKEILSRITILPDVFRDYGVGSIHLIHIPDKETRKRAIAIFHRVPMTRVRLPGNVMGVTDEHIEALHQARIPFEYISKEPVNGQGPQAG